MAVRLRVVETIGYEYAVRQKFFGIIVLIIFHFPFLI